VGHMLPCQAHSKSDQTPILLTLAREAGCLPSQLRSAWFPLRPQIANATGVSGPQRHASQLRLFWYLQLCLYNTLITRKVQALLGIRLPMDDCVFYDYLFFLQLYQKLSPLFLRKLQILCKRFF